MNSTTGKEDGHLSTTGKQFVQWMQQNGELLIKTPSSRNMLTVSPHLQTVITIKELGYLHSGNY